jgi:hypothetical protein
LIGRSDDAPAQVLAAAAAATRWARLPPAVQGQARDLIRDTLAVIAAGAQHPTLALPADHDASRGGVDPRTLPAGSVTNGRIVEDPASHAGTTDRLAGLPTR